MYDLGSWVACLRREKNWSQRKLAMKASISNTEIARIERNERTNLTLDMVFKLSSAFEVSIVDFLLGTGFVDSVSLGGYIKLADDEANIIADYRRLDERGKEAVVETVRRELRYAVG